MSPSPISHALKLMDIANYTSMILKSSTLTVPQVESILLSKNNSGRAFSKEVEREKNLSSAEKALSFLCQHLNIPFMDEVSVQDISSSLVQSFPISYAKTHMVLPLKEDQNTIYVLSANPLNFGVFSDLKLKFKKKVQPVICTSSMLLEAINGVYERSSGELEELSDIIIQEDYDLESTVIDLLDTEDSAPVIKLINTLLFRAVKERASDIHIEPYEKDMVVRFRVDGVLHTVFKPPKRLQNAIVSRVKIMGNLNIAEKRLPQDGRIHLRLAGKDIDIRLSSLPTSFGERLVMRLQDRTQVLLQLKDLGFSEENLKSFYSLLEKSYGIILITGPTGSGKSTTLYAALNHINSEEQNIITVEDPVERRIKGIGQIQVNPKIGLTFASGLRSVLRQDPNTIMIGEIRDSETMKIAINASLTGHLVLSTLHTNDSAAVFPRLIDMGGEPFLIATSIVGVMAQRLVRVLCPGCKKGYRPSKKDLLFLKSEDKNTRIPSKIFKPEGCRQCEFKGYEGRTMIQEILVVDEDIRTLVMRHKDSHSIKKSALAKGMTSFRQNGIQKVCQGITTIEEVIHNSQLDL